MHVTVIIDLDTSSLIIIIISLINAGLVVLVLMRFILNPFRHV